MDVHKDEMEEGEEKKTTRGTDPKSEVKKEKEPKKDPQNRRQMGEVEEDAQDRRPGG